MLTRPANGFLAYRAEDDLFRVENHHRLINTLMILSTLLQRASDVISFGPHRLIPAERLLLKQEEVVGVGNRAFDILVALD
jgi:hypothetical protein